MVFWNALRALTFIECVTLIAMSYRVWAAYYQRYRIAHVNGASDRRHGVRGKARGNDERAPWLGLLPAHVWKLAVGTAGTGFTLALLAVDRINHVPFMHGIPLMIGIVALGIAISGLRDALRYEERLMAPR